MVNPENDIEREYRHAEWDKMWREAGEAWRPDAIAVLDILGRGKYAAVDAPHGTGKSGILIPKLAVEARARGYNIPEQYYHWVMPYPVTLGRTREEIEKFGAEILPKQGLDRRLLVIDEAGHQAEQVNLLQDISSYLVENKIDLALIAPGRNHEVRREIMNLWREALRPLGKELVSHEMKQRTLPIDLVRDYLTKIGGDKDLREFYEDPENISLLTPSGIELSQHAPARSVSELQEKFLKHSIWGTMMSGAGLSKHHLRKLLQNLGVYDRLSPLNREIFERAIDFD